MSDAAIDTREAYDEPLRGVGRYVRGLTAGLREEGVAFRELRKGWPGPELLYEQVGMPRAARGAALVHAPNCFLPLRRPCPGVVTMHDLAFEAHPGDFSARTGWKFRTFAPRSARSAERVVCVSRFTAEDVAGRYGVAAERIRVVPNAPSLPLGDGPVPDGDYVLGIGDLRAKKRWDVLAAAWRRLGGPTRLVIAGLDAGEGDALRRQGVECPGYVADAELDALLRGARALVHPSAYEGFGLVLLEAMARGTPVACSDAPALSETAGGAAALFAEGDVDACAEALRALLDDPGPWGERGRARAAEFSWRRTARETAAVYRELA